MKFNIKNEEELPFNEEFNKNIKSGRWKIVNPEEAGISFEEPSFKEKATSMAYGFNKGLGKTVDSVAAAGNALYGGISEGLETASSLVGADNLAKDFGSLKEQAYGDANKLWNGKVAEQYVEDNKPDAIDKYANTDQKHVIDNWVSAGHTVESLAEMSGAGAVLKLTGKGVVALANNSTTKNFLVNNKVTNWLNNFLTVPINPTNVGSAAVGGYLANDFRSEDEVVRENTPIEDTARTLGGYIAGDIAVRGGYGAITGTTKYILESTLPKTMYNKLTKTAENISTEYKEPFVKALNNGLDSVQETVGNLVNGLVFKPTTENGKLTMKRIREIEQAAKESIEYISDTNVLSKTQSSFGKWLLSKKGNTIDMDFLESVSPELVNLIKNKGDKKEILAELVKNKELLTAYTVQKNNDKALDIALHLPDYILQEKILKNANKSIIDRIKTNVFDFSKNASENTFGNKIEDLKNLLPQFNTLLTKERNINHDYYKQILNNNPNSIVSLEEFLPELKKLTEEFQIFAASKKDNISEISELEKVSDLFNTMYQEALNSGSRNVNGNIVKNAVSPIALVNKRQSLNDISFKGNSNVEKLQLKAVNLIDRIIDKNTNLGYLPEEFLSTYRRALDFDSRIYFAHTQNEIVKTLIEGEPTHYISNIMNTSRGVEEVRKALSNTTENYKKFHNEIDFINKNKKEINNYFERTMFAYKKGQNKSKYLGDGTYIDKNGFEVNKTYYGTSKKEADVIGFPTKQDVIKAKEFKTNNDIKDLKQLSLRYKININENKQVIDKLDSKSKELFDALRQIKLKKLIFEDFVNYEKTSNYSNNFNFDAFKIHSTILNNENLIRSLLRDDVKADFVIKKLPTILHKIGELGSKIKLQNNNNNNNNLYSTLNKFAAKTGVAGVLGTTTGVGPLGGIAIASGFNVGWNMFMRGVANSFDKPETTMKLIGLIEKGNDKNILKFILKQANIYSYNIIKNDVGGSKEYLKDKGKQVSVWLLEPQTVPWNER
jgi:hypothetical protein